jgi:hypothetical protein
MHFAERFPSTAWESIPFPDDPHCFVWAWFKPAGAPQGLVVRVPDEIYRDPVRRGAVTMRRVLRAAGIDARSVAMWTLYGAAYDARQGASPALDYPIPEPAMGTDPALDFPIPAPSPGADPSIHVVVNSFVPGVAAPAPLPPAAAPSPGGVDAFAHIAEAWNLSLVLEQQLAAAAKQLNATLLRLNSLNRDLSSEEGRSADQLDKKEWQDARRWLRDIAARVSRFLKDHHIGMTSAAGKRGSFEAIYEQYVVPRRNFDGLVQAERDFEQYCKTMQTLLNNMNAAQTSAAQDGERRAQLVLTRISAKARAARTKK